MTILQEQSSGPAIMEPAGDGTRRPYMPPRTDARAIRAEEMCMAAASGASEVIEGEKTFDSAISNANGTFEAFDANDFSDASSWN